MGHVAWTKSWSSSLVTKIGSSIRIKMFKHTYLSRILYLWSRYDCLCGSMSDNSLREYSLLGSFQLPPRWPFYKTMCVATSENTINTIQYNATQPNNRTINSSWSDAGGWACGRDQVSGRVSRPSSFNYRDKRGRGLNPAGVLFPLFLFSFFKLLWPRHEAAVDQNVEHRINPSFFPFNFSWLKINL